MKIPPFALCEQKLGTYKINLNENGAPLGVATCRRKCDFVHIEYQ